MSNRMTAACGLVLALVAVPVAHAQVTIDISKVTCDQFLGYKTINPNDIAMWLSGYYNAQRGNTIIDVETLAAQKRELQDYCLRNLKVPVMQAIDKLFHAPAPAPAPALAR
jgi:acid stress chaperone HdeB